LNEANLIMENVMTETSNANPDRTSSAMPRGIGSRCAPIIGTADRLTQSNNRDQHTMTATPLNPALVARMVLLDNSVSGLRNVDSLGSILTVSAGPFSALDRVKAAVRSPYIAYVIDTPLVYAGYGRASRNIGEQVAEQLQPTSQVYIIHANDARFAKFEAAYIEARIVEIGAALGMPLANRVRPFGRDGLAASPDHEQLVAQARILLSVAGFKRFEEAQQSRCNPSARTPVTGNLHDVQVLDPEAMTIPADIIRMQLICRDIQAQGFARDERFHVLPGADYVYGDRSGLSEDNRQRRRAIETMDILEPIPGNCGRARLLVGLDCKSPAMAGKILSGEHIGNKAWQRVQPDLSIGILS
jgi:hypothetical protein